MRKSTVFFALSLTVLSLGLTLVPNVSSQPESIKVLSYSWYIDSLGYFVVVGEVQNVGPNTINIVGLGGTVYTTDGTAQADSFTQALAQYLIPQQKAPFYMEFPPSSSVTGDLSWLSGLDRVDFQVGMAEATTNYMYQDLTIKEASATIATDGVYWVSGSVQNIGSQNARNIRVVGTFYNSTGSVVAMGYTDVLTPVSLGPSGTASFKVGAFDLNQTEVPSNLIIATASLLIQAEEPVLSGTPPPPSIFTTGPASTSPPDSTPPSTTPPSSTTPSTSPGSLAPEYVYGIVAAIVIIGLAVTLLVLRKRKTPASISRGKSQVNNRRKNGSRRNRG